MAHALIVDDEADIAYLAQKTLEHMGIDTTVAYTLADAINAFDAGNFDFCLTDLHLPDGNGLDLVRHVTKTDTPIAVITAHGSVDTAIEALKLGAFDFVNKPMELQRVRELATNALKLEPATPVRSPQDELLDARLIGKSAPMANLRATIKKLARSQAPVFLWGGSGTGKEVVAKLIHDLSPRAEGSFVPVNCGAIPSELMESEFFGHKKGSFTGAVGDKIGLFQQADGGTLFLDEVADLPLVMQVKLLRAIQEKTVRAIGDTKETPVNVRILSATHKNLVNLVQMGQFRQDLYYRINVIEVILPTLNERRDDIADLARHFLALIAEDWGMEQVPVLTDDAIAMLSAHNFEGNVRELRNLLERAVTLSEGDVIDRAQLGDLARPTLAPNLQTQPLPNTPQDAHTPPMPNVAPTSVMPNGIAPNGIAPISIAPTNPPANTTPSTPSHASPTLDGEIPDNLENFLEDQERQVIERALIAAKGNKTRAAAILGTSFRSLRYRMKKLGLDDD